MKSPTELVKQKALELGFSKVGIAEATYLKDERNRLDEWLRRGFHGTMTWMEKNSEKRADPRKIVSQARSVIVVALNYYTPYEHTHSSAVGKISRYAWGDDYHDVLTERLAAFWEWIRGEFPGVEGRYYVDTGPVMEKVWAERAGIGWLAKHTNIITQEYGSWVFLGEIITTLELVPDAPATDHCGTCTLCIEACPTHAIMEPYVVDANLCLSYLTIEHRGEFAGKLVAKFENWIYGCDVCQDVCPWNKKFAAETSEPGFQPREGNLAPRLDVWEGMTQEEFGEKFKGSPIKRTKKEGLVRNIRAAIGERPKGQPEP